MSDCSRTNLAAHPFCTMYFLQILFYIAIVFPAFLRAAICPSSDHESLLQLGRDYSYTFHGEAVVSHQDGKEDRISLRCDIDISHINACHFGLYMENCFLRKNSQIEDETLELLSKYPVLFSLVNGEIMEIHTNEEEPLHALNIKRGILSTFIFKISHTKHASQTIITDIHGTCPLTTMPLETAKGSVKTTRNLRMCNRTSKEEEKFVFFSSKLNDVDSTIDCDYDINLDKRRLNQINCTEKYSSGAIQSNIYYHMTSKSSRLQKGKADFSSATRRVDIQFEQEQQPNPEPGHFVRLASQLVEHSFNGIELSTISEFTGLVAWLRSASNLTTLLKEIPENNCLDDEVECLSRKRIAMSYFANALVQCNNVPCIEGISHMIKSGEFPPSNYMYYSWSKIHSPEPAFLKHLMNICYDTDSKLCWTTLGSFIQKIYLKQQNLVKSKEQLFETSKCLKKSIKFLCATAESDFKTLRRNLEIIKSMGDVCMLLSFEDYQELIGCYLKSYLPDDIQLLILEVLKAINPNHNVTSGKEIYKEFYHILLNSTFSTNLRIIAYDQIFRVPQIDEFGNIVLTILKADENLQLKSHIAKSLKTLFSNTNLNSSEKRFATALHELLETEKLSLNRIIHENKVDSMTESNSISIDSIFQELSDIGYKILNSKGNKFFNESLEWNNIFIQVIRHLGHTFGFGDQNSMQLETLAILLQEMANDIQAQLQSSEGLFKTVQEIMKQFGIHSKPPQEYNYFETILNNIRKLEEVYWKHKLESKTFFTRVSDFIGSTWRYFSSGEIFQLPTRLLDMRALLRDLEEGVNYNTTRVIRIMEVHQQVPTMMGLPLRWDRSVDFAFSLRSGFKLEMQKENIDFLLKAFLQPSAALTYLDGMGIDLPSVAQVGWQVNKSAFASTEWKAKLFYNEERKIFSFDKPSRSKNILQFFDTHRLMKHGVLHDGEDGRREASSSCSDGLLSSLLGLQFCVLQSHAKLPQSSYWTWQIFLQPSDKKIESYNLEFMRPQEKKSQDTILKYSTFGSTNRREIFFIIGNGKLNGEVKFQMKIPALPQFNLYLQSLKGTRNYKIVMNLTLFESHYYEIIYEAEYELLKSRSDTEDISKNSKIQGRLFSFRTPSNKYSASLTDYGKKRIDVTMVILSYNSFNLDGRWFYGILPQSFWETDTTAWLQIQIFWNAEITKNSQQSICIIKDPHSTTQLSTGFLHYNGGERKYMCASKTQTSSGKLLAAAHFTYDFWKQNDAFNEVQIQTFNLTVAQKSWAVDVLKERKGGKFSYEITFTRAALVSEVEETCGNAASWSEESDIYNSQQPELKLAVDAEIQVMSSRELADKYSVVKEQELAGLWNQIIKANLSFHYPFVSGQESVKAEGNVIASGGPTTTRFQLDLNIKSSYHNLQLTSHSVYRSDEDFISLHYNSQVKHVPTNKKIFHNVYFWMSTPAGECLEAELGHTFSSRVFDLSTIVTYRCKPNHIDLHDLRLNMQSNSSTWNMLNLSISQLVENQTPEYTFETCNVTHPLLLINVTADWVGKMRDHKKRALFTCRQENCRSTELLIQFLHDGKMAADLIIPENPLITPYSKRRKLSFERTISSDAKIQNCKIAFSKDEASGLEGLHLKGEILNENYQIWNLKLHLDTCAEICTLLVNGYQKVLHHAIAIAKDGHHPVNKMFHSSFKLTLYEYLESLYKQGDGLLTVTWNSFVELVDSVNPIYEAPLTLLLDARTAWKTRLAADMITNYLDFSSYFYSIRENIYQFLKPREKVLEWEFVTNRIIKLESFNQWPSISLEEIYIDRLTGQKHTQSQQGLTEVNKIAMIINSSHVFRFDEHLYPSALSSSDCVFLLAKDIRESTFTVLSAQERIHVLFPEMTVSVSKENSVFINDSQIPTKFPVKTSSGNIHVRKDEASVEIQSPSLTVSCRVQQTSHLCLLELDFRHYLETFGLLGGFSSNEFSIPEGETASNILKFVNKYEVSGKAECKHLNQKTKFPTSSGNAEFCTRKLIQLCHLNWNILQQFVDMCKLGFKEDAISGYSALCDYGNLRNSTTHKGKFWYSESQTIEIVFVVQEHHSLQMAESTLKGIEQLMVALNNQFVANGFSEVLFSLIGFGARNSHDQSVFHIKQRTWLTVHDALKRLDFDGEEDTDIPNVLKSISQPMDYDLFHSKFFLLLTTKETLSKNKDSVNEVKQFLKKSGSLLYALFPRPSDSKDKDNLICTSPKGEGHPPSECPEGFLPKLASSNEGSVFCLFTEHSDSFFETVATHAWSVTTQGSLTCSANHNWWERMDICPSI